MNILIAGDFCDNGRVTQKIHDGDYKSIFEDVKPIVRNADFSIVNFEFPIVQSNGQPIVKCGPNLKGQKESIDAIKYAGFNVCTLANNHVLDQGEECCLDTKRLLEESGIKTVGVGKDINAASTILYLEKSGERLAVINCCEHEFSIATEDGAGANPLNPIQQYHKILEARRNADYVLVIVHGGHEHYQLPSPRMKEVYHFFIDVGADAVVNHHQHCFSGYEEYNGKPIFYGLGNFCFDDTNVPIHTWHNGFLVALNTKERKYEVIPYKQFINGEQIVKLRGHDYEEFCKEIKNLNNIIISDLSLKKEYINYIEKDNVTQMLEPYDGRISRALFRRGLLPSSLTTNRSIVILNYLMCESHLDKLIHSLKNKINLR